MTVMRNDLGRAAPGTVPMPAAFAERSFARIAQTPAVLYVTPEIADFVQTGGLGEVAAALPRALRTLCDVRVLVPGYRYLMQQHRDIGIVASLPRLAGIPPCTLGKKVTADGLAVYVLICPELYDRPGTPYGDESGRDWPDNDVRFARLSLAAADMAAGLGDPAWRPAYLHLNDWPSALASGYLAWRGQDVPSLLTIHNLAYQGCFDPARMPHLGIPPEAFRVDGIEFYGRLSFLKAGVYYASHLTTVSETYAEEITRPEFGCGMDGLLRHRARQGRLSGILNGIDESWDPRGGASAARFHTTHWKTRNADHVRGAFGLALSRGPLFAIVSRLVHQKGIDLAIETADAIVRQGGQLVVTGTGDAHFESALRALRDRYPGRIGVRIGFDPEEARRMFAGSDFLLMPSRFEPCGLSQMYAQRMGSLPIAHRTGGLADTIRDGRTGFLFGDFSQSGIQSALRRALEVFASTRKLSRMRRSAMASVFGWQDSAKRYARLYERLPA